MNRRAASAVLAAATALATLAPAAASADTTPTRDPVEAAAGHLAEALVEGERIETTFDGATYPDPGLTADVVLALAGTATAADEIASATTWLREAAAGYTGTATGEVYAGSLAKLLIVADATSTPTQIDGLDLVAELEATEDAQGRYRDTAQFGDFSNVITQSLGVVALVRADGTAPSTAAVDYLASRACDDGSFPEALEGDDCVGDVDSTTFAVQALLAAGEEAVADDAVTWLLGEQNPDGGLGGEASGPNANSTGLAALVFSLVGEQDAATDARTFLLARQDDCTSDTPGAIRYSDSEAGDVTRATAQALPGLTGVGLAGVSSSDALAERPKLECPHKFADVDYTTSVHAESILALTDRGVVSGRADGTFDAEGPVTRGQFATWFTATAGVEPVEGHGFGDIAGSVHEGAIAALADEGAVTGYADGTFRASQPVTRAHAAAIIARWLELAPVATDAFVDVADSTHRLEINAAADAGIVAGRDGAFSPDAPLRRDQATSLLDAALGEEATTS